MSTLTETVRELSSRPVVADRRVRLALGALAFAAMTALGARVSVPLPFTPVPVTLQPMFVILAGAFLGAWGGAASMSLYLTVGALGAPVFAGGGAGLAWLLGPTGGYLVSYPFAAFAVGWLRGSGGSWRTLGALTAGMLLIYLGGLSQLWILTRQDLPALLAQAAYPFVLGDVAKILFSLGVVRALERRRAGLVEDGDADV